jgi:hypothetical protein
MSAPTKEELEAAACWEAADLVPRRPAMTDFRRAARYHQARWREANHLPIGTQPIVPKPGDTRVRPVGSRLPLDHARETGATFLTPAALAAARARTALVEPHQSIDHQRLWADLLSSAALTFNLFGELAADLDLADRAVHRWVPDAPGRVRDVRFLHSPGWLDPAYLNTLRSFAAAFSLDLDDGTHGIVAFDVAFHERSKAETPRPENLHRYVEVAERSGEFVSGAIDRLQRRGDLCVLWIEHLLLLSMLQHPSSAWTWGRLVLVHPAGNSDVVDVVDRYRSLLRDDSTFTLITLEQVLDTGVLPHAAALALRERYVSSLS